jgi:flagellar basal-body rod protein FlgG
VDNGIQAACSGLRAQVDALAILANNLANLNTTAFKEELAFFTQENQSSSKSQDVDEQIGAVANQLIRTQGTMNTTEGSLSLTNQSLDVALEGNGYLKVQTPNGIRYTRSGSLQLNAQSVLTAAGGHPVLGATDQPITLGPGEIHIDEEGKIFLNNTRIDSLKVVAFDNLQGFDKEGGSLLALRPGQGTEIASNARVRSGYLEQSNVNPVSSVVRLVEIMRNFEAIQKSISAVMNDMDSKSIDKLSR